ncbi:hypothetical protein HGK72_26655 [Mycolicibacterium fortuitum]|uniref:hypothetical protein n=1 Tax=Mycolicibacterium fortuitum TaxID=1766 RepID=UPI0014901048|nr:hypothetical protein [Mycolicibacterium fortuitum]
MSGELNRMDAADARALTDRIKVGVEAVWELIKQAYTERAWDALGYSSWDDYCTREFGASRLRLPREERAEVVASLRESGLSTRAIAAATGLARNTVLSDLRDRDEVVQIEPPADAEPIAAQPDGDDQPLIDFPEQPGCRDCGGYGCETCFPEVEDEPQPEPEPAPKPITGTDGKTYTPKPKPATPQPSKRKPLPDAFWRATYDLKKRAESIVRLADDDRFKKNKDQIADVNLSDLIRVRDALNGVIQQLEG